MALGAPPAAETAPRGRTWPAQAARWMLGHGSLALSVMLTSLAALAPLTAVGPWSARHGLAGLWIYLAFALPQGWAMWVMSYTLFNPDLVTGGDRRAATWRWLRWSTMAGALIAEIPALYYDHLADVLGLSGWLVLLIGLDLVGRAPSRLRLALARLSAREVLVPPTVVEQVRRGLERVGNGRTVASGLCVAIALLVTSPPALLAAIRSQSWEFGPTVSSLALLIVAGAVAGSWLGRMIGYGRVLGRALRKRELRLRMIAGHPDGAAGLKPVGDFHLYQSLMASLPAIFLGVWLLLISLGGASRLLRAYRPYLTGYLWLLALAMLFEILVFVLPMSSVHAIMKSQKQDVFLPEADRLSLAVAAARSSVDQSAGGEEGAAKPDLAGLLERYQELENVPTWPVDSSIRRKFTLRNLGLLVPFLGFIVGHMPFWQQISDVLKG